MSAWPSKSQLGCTVTTLAGIGFFGWLLSIGITGARDAARDSQCLGNLCQISLALQNYHSLYGCFPPAYVADAEGTPMHSWRVLILPFMEQHKLYDAYNFEQPWNGPHNRKLADVLPGQIIACPSDIDTAPGHTSYLAILGDGTMWNGPHSFRLDDDDDIDPIAVIEVCNSGIHWMEPRDITLEEALAGIDDPARPLRIASRHFNSPNYVTARGHRRTFPKPLTREWLREHLALRKPKTLTREWLREHLALPKPKNPPTEKTSR